MKFKSFIHAKPASFIGVCGVAGVLQFGVLAGSAQTNIYLFTGSVRNITLNPGLYDITAYGARGGNLGGNSGGLGAKMEGRFSFATTVNLRLLVGGAGGTDLMSYAAGGSGGSDGGYAGGGGGGGYSGDGSNASGGGGGGSSFLNGGAGGGGGGIGGYNSGGYGGGGGAASTGAGGGGGYSGGGGGSIIDSSVVAIIAEASGIASPDGSPNGEIIITAVPKPIVLASASTAGGNFGFNITGPTNATIVIEVCTNLANAAWIPVATKAVKVQAGISQ